MGVMPSFIKTNEVISPFDLYEKFNSSRLHGLVSTQFLAFLALNLFNIKIVSNKILYKKTFFYSKCIRLRARSLTIILKE